MKALLVDTLATIVFFTAIAAFTELYIVGLPPEQVLMARLIMIPVMAFTGRPYGVWRDWLERRVCPIRAWSRIATEVAAFLSFQVPVYAATLAIAGASVGEIATAVVTATGFMVLIARPFGVFLDWVRRLSGVSAA